MEELKVRLTKTAAGFKYTYNGEVYSAKQKANLLMDISRDHGMIITHVEQFLVDEQVAYEKEEEATKFREELSEEAIWQMVDGHFEAGPKGGFKLKEIPEWDDMLKARGKDLFGERADCTMGELESSIAKMYNHYKKEFTFNTPLSIFLPTIDYRIRTADMHHMKNLSIDIQYEKQENDYLYEWLKAMETEDIDFAYSMFKHWLWQVKRNLISKKTRFPVFPVLTSKNHGTGKSWTIKYLLNPLKQYAINADLNDITEERSIGKDSGRYLVMNFDEMSGSNRTTIEALKKWVTEEVVSYRPMGKNNKETVEKIASGIGTSNKRISSLISDPTGNRRFVELFFNTKTRPELTKTAEYDENGIAWLSIWKNIDESLERGYFDPEEDQELKQYVAKSLASGSTDESFLEIFNFQCESKPYKVSEIYSLYSSYCSYAGNQRKNKSNFFLAMQTLSETLEFKTLNPRKPKNCATIDLPLLHVEFAQMLEQRVGHATDALRNLFHESIASETNIIDAVDEKRKLNLGDWE